MAEDARLYLGLRLNDRYMIEDHIGSGLSAHAFKAYDTLLMGRVVVKIIKTEIAGVPIELGEEWKEESRKAMQVRGHPHIASILDLGEEIRKVSNEDETIHFIVMEFIEGVTLRDLIADPTPLDPHSLLTIALQLLNTLEFLQVRKLAHGDLHSGNIMISRLGVDRPFIKVIDFGMASNTLIPRNRGKDIHFALSQLDQLCQKALESIVDAHVTGILESFAALLKKGQNFIPIGRMSIKDLVSAIDQLQQDLNRVQTPEQKSPAEDEGPRRRIEVQRRTPFVGRMTELPRMYELTTESFVSKEGAMLFVSGEAGIGKTRLVDELLGRFAADRIRHLVLYKKCPHEVPNLPYATLFDALIAFLDDVPGQNDLERLNVVLGTEHSASKSLARLIGEHRAALIGDSPPGEGSASSNTPYLFATFLKQAALMTPVVLYIDDLHWADTATIEFLGFLAPRISESSIVTVATYRPEDLTPQTDGQIHPVIELMVDLDRKDSVRTFDLTGLERENLDEILSNLYTFLQPADFTILSDSVRRMAGGNPYYLFEITGLMVDEGYLVTKGDTRWALQGDLAEFAVPESINNLIERRIERLSLNEILLLRAASLQGESFELSILHQMFSPSGETIPEILESLMGHHGLVQAREEGRYIFDHHQVHRVVSNGMSADDAERGHKEVAKLLEKTAVENETPVPHHLVAHHLALAGERRSAARHFLEAGKRALNAQQFHLALDHLRRAADLIQSVDDEVDLSAEITMTLLEAVKPLGERSIHERAVKRLSKLAKHTNRPDLLLRAMLEECIHLRTISAHEDSLAVAEKLVEFSRKMEDPTTEAAALKEAGTASYLLGNMDHAEEFFHQAAGILASTGDIVQLARVYNNLGLVCRNTQRQEEMVQYYRRALDIFREAGDTIGERFPLGNLGLVYFEQGEYERAFECFSTLKASLGNRADLMIEGKVDLSIGEIYYEIGLLHEAKDACESALNTFLTIGNRQGESEALGTLGGIHLYLGDIQIAKGYFEQSLDVKRTIGNIVGMLHSQVTLARIANMEGRQEEAIYLAEQVLEGAKERDNKAIALEAVTEILHAKSKTESPTKALKLLTQQFEPENLVGINPSVLVTFAYKVGEISFTAGDEARALKYIGLAGRLLEKTMESIENPEWREAYRKKRERIFETYQRLKPALAKL